MKKKEKKNNNVAVEFDFTAQNMYDKLIKLVDANCDDSKAQEIIKQIDDLIDYIYLYW